MTEASILIGLFLISFGAATILPLQSEVALVGLLGGSDLHWGPLVLVASIGNILGSVVNWGLGRYVHQFHDRPWFPLKAGQLVKFEKAYQKYGAWTLLLSWAPVIGDPLTVVAGLLKEPLWIFLILVSVAKVGRYLFIVWALGFW